jgi:hypothetical protein
MPLTLRPKVVALIAYLALEGRDVPRRDIARLLFPEAEQPRAVLRWHLAQVRSMAPSPIARHLKATRDSAALRISTDVALFRRNAQVISRRPGTRGAPRALALYRDDLVAGLAVSASAEFDNWLYVAQEVPVAHEDGLDAGGVIERIENAPGVTTRHPGHKLDAGFLEHSNDGVRDVRTRFRPPPFAGVASRRSRSSRR